MITRQDLQELQSFTYVPALSILLPTHRTSPDNKQDPIQVKNLVDEAKSRLSEQFAAREIEPLFKKLDALVETIKYSHTLDGLALYVSHEFAKLYYLPFTVPARVIIDKTFATRDLLYGLHRNQCYWVVLLSQNSTRLISGIGETLEEVEDKNFPMPMTGPGATEATPPDSDSSYMDDRLRRFYQKVDQALNEYNQADNLPLVVGGDIRQISFFQEVSQYSSAIAGTMTGNFDKSTLAEINPEVWQIVQSVREAKQAEAMQALDAAMGVQMVISTIEEAWKLSQEGRAKMLLVEKNYHVPAVLTENGGLQLTEAVGGTEVMDDAVDEVIEVVLAKGGEVAIVDDGKLAVHQRFALILRY